MKKLFALALAFLMLAVPVACAAKNADDPKTAANDAPAGDEPVAGGWMNAEDPAMNDELRAVFQKALGEILGVDYVPVACLGTQVVAGTNYCFLAQATAVYPDAAPRYVLVYVYEDLSGEASILNVADLPVVPNEDGTASVPEAETLGGGWFYADDPAITDETAMRFYDALQDKAGATYEPLVNVAAQVVAGMNRCVLARVTPDDPNAHPHYALVYVWEKLDGTTEFLRVIDLDVGALCTYGM